LSAMISSHAHYADQGFKEVHVEHDQLVSSELYDCVFVRCSFVETVFRKCRFANCAFQQCDLSLVQVPYSTSSSARFSV